MRNDLDAIWQRDVHGCIAAPGKLRFQMCGLLRRVEMEAALLPPLQSHTASSRVASLWPSSASRSSSRKENSFASITSSFRLNQSSRASMDVLWPSAMLNADCANGAPCAKA
eukprot:CAMPEP_0179027842 /NCGR_PEP_ID=MMETSP0796-20121207/9242_1 /TAXON_ID=73915 /ORGANISM="Pyrodinium bahamense, Strain pbaha01" /LENGTH=111 /DNA_ID=CAMNT_0020723973 /DNA_START=198 /DNA_END=531 /DNA_ORIENTATION=-